MSKCPDAIECEARLDKLYSAIGGYIQVWRSVTDLDLVYRVDLFPQST